MILIDTNDIILRINLHICSLKLLLKLEYTKNVYLQKSNNHTNIRI